MGVERLFSHIARALRIPVLTLAILALVVVLAELGALAVDLFLRRRRSLDRTEEMLAVAQAALSAGDVPGALAAMRAIALTPDMADVLTAIVLQLSAPDAEERISKRLADYEYRHLRRLERTRILVRAGPALGLMGTLIPLSPALSGLAHGDVTVLTSNLQVAFSVTVTGLLIGALAFSISLIRDRLYSQDYSDVQYVAATLTGENVDASAGGNVEVGVSSAPALLTPPGAADIRRP
jgi:biopolymer transport protein ExbB/TolQ